MDLNKLENILNNLENKFSDLSFKIEKIEDEMMLIEDDILKVNKYFSLHDKLYDLEEKQGMIQEKIEDIQEKLNLLKELETETETDSIKLDTFFDRYINKYSLRMFHTLDRLKVKNVRHLKSFLAIKSESKRFIVGKLHMGHFYELVRAVKTLEHHNRNNLI